MNSVGIRNQSDGRPRLIILTQNCFVQCDVEILPILQKDFDISWTVVYPRDDKTGFTEESILQFGLQNSIETQTFRFKNRLRSILTLQAWIKIIRGLRNRDPAIVYINASGHPWLAPLVRILLGKKCVIWAIHDVLPHQGTYKAVPAESLYKRYIYRNFNCFHFLSKNQKTLFSKYSNSKKMLYYAPHPPLTYGSSCATPPRDKTVFLFFGFISHYKGLDMLIMAAEKLWKEGFHSFNVKISGYTDEWIPYQKLIHTPEIFTLDIRPIPNAIIPELYSTSHWLVLPYRDVTQSGPMSLAYQYNTPTITSSLNGFSEFVVEDKTGMMFETENFEALCSTMKRAVTMQPSEYIRFKADLMTFVQSHYSLESCRNQYSEMFKEHLTRIKNVVFN
jgi:glycosyltransferase involved in cell wall biosynthesis